MPLSAPSCSILKQQSQAKKYNKTTITGTNRWCKSNSMWLLCISLRSLSVGFPLISIRNLASFSVVSFFACTGTNRASGAYPSQAGRLDGCRSLRPLAHILLLPHRPLVLLFHCFSIFVLLHHSYFFLLFCSFFICNCIPACNLCTRTPYTESAVHFIWKLVCIRNTCVWCVCICVLMYGYFNARMYISVCLYGHLYIYMHLICT